MTTPPSSGSPPADLDAVGQRFADAVGYFASSPLYRRLAAATAHDTELLRLTAGARTGQHEAFLLFGAVHYLLARQSDDPLTGYFEDLVPVTATGDPFPEFRRFCLERSVEIVELIRGRLVQTNDPQRSALLLLGIDAAVGHESGPIALLEVGASAGLNLCFDRYSYDFGAIGRCGVPGSPVVIRCQAVGPVLPELPTAIPAVAWRMGIDLNPIDVRDPDAVAWLQALLAPEDAGRREMLDTACAMAAVDPPPVVEGDALVVLDSVAAEIPPDLPICIFHSGVLFHIHAEERHLFGSAIARLAETRQVHWLSVETSGTLHHPARVHAGMVLGLSSFAGAGRRDRVLALSDGPTQWVEWCA